VRPFLPRSKGDNTFRKETILTKNNASDPDFLKKVHTFGAEFHKKVFTFEIKYDKMCMQTKIVRVCKNIRKKLGGEFPWQM